MERQDVLQAIQSEPNISVLIIGAGINGIGVFRELALHNIDVLMVDKGDFCSGASAASSHMLHGGVRYLEYGEFRLVREALQERNRLLKNAPHYAKPLRTTIPIFKWLSGTINAPLKFFRLRNKAVERGAFVIKMGLIIYDWFVRKNRSMPTHSFSLSGDSLTTFPMMSQEVLCTATYYDAWMPYPERISMELILDAEAASSRAKVLNYVSVVDGTGDTVTLKDELTDESYMVKPSILINAAGPWIDFVNRAMKQHRRMIGGTKGSHLILDHPELYEATNGSEIFFENDDGRIVLIFPFVGRVMVGTTDIRIEEPDEVRCTDDEVDYILSMVSKIFPDITVDLSHIVFRFSGVRPLPYSDAAFTGQISRDHSIETIEPDDEINFPIYSLVGGKWTTFRAFSEQVADRIFKYLKQARRVSTTEMPIGGGRDYPQSDAAQERWLSELHHKTHLPEDRVRQLFERYGTRAETIAMYICEEDDSPLVHQPDYSRREIMFLATQEKVVHLDDLILRRSLLAMLGQVSRDLLVELSQIIAPILDWSKENQQREVTRTLNLLQDRHGVAL